MINILMCKYCELYKSGNKYAETKYWNYYIEGDTMIAVWYQHESIKTISRCKSYFSMVYDNYYDVYWLVILLIRSSR